MKLFRYTFAVVDERAITENVRRIRAHLSPSTQLMIAVKANGYGHGVERVVAAAQAGGADAFAVASVEEGIALRQFGCKSPVLVLGFVSLPGARVAAEYQLAVTYTDTWGDIATLPKFPQPLTVHVKVDTGMNRLGLRDSASVLDVLKRLSGRSDIVISGLFTHLACSDEPESSCTSQQNQKFEEIVQATRRAGYDIPFVHAANSGGVLHHTNLQYNMVRVGISTYGYAPNPDVPSPVELNPALHLYGLVTRVQTIEAGETIGYGATFTAKRRMQIATVPIGYADGYPRILSNGGCVVVHGVRTEIVGRVCMDQLMIDVSGIDDVHLGDPVTFYGRLAPDVWTQARFDELDAAEQVDFIRQTFALHTSGSRLLSLHDIANLANTISYELMCALSVRVPRVYIPTVL